MKHVRSNAWVVFAVVILLGFFFFSIMRNYISMMVLSLIVALVFDKQYKLLRRVLGPLRGMSSFLMSLLVFIGFIIPLVFVIWISADQAVSFANGVVQDVQKGEISTEVIISSIQSIEKHFPEGYSLERLTQDIDVGNMVSTAANGVGDFFSTVVPAVILNSAGFLTNAVIFFFVMMYMFRDKDLFLRKLVEISPLDDTDDWMFIDRFHSMAGTLVKGTLLIAIVQGTLGGIAFAFLGISSPVFFGLMMVFASFIPLGAGIIWWPASIILLFMGQIWQGVVLILFGNLVIGTVDNIIRAKLLENTEVSLPPLITLLSVLGGVNVFGFAGILYGPLIAMLFLTSLHLYEQYDVGRSLDILPQELKKSPLKKRRTPKKGSK